MYVIRGHLFCVHLPPLSKAWRALLQSDYTKIQIRFPSLNIHTFMGQITSLTLARIFFNDIKLNQARMEIIGDYFFHEYRLCDSRNRLELEAVLQKSNISFYLFCPFLKPFLPLYACQSIVSSGIELSVNIKLLFLALSHLSCHPLSCTYSHSRVWYVTLLSPHPIIHLAACTRIVHGEISSFSLSLASPLLYSSSHISLWSFPMHLVECQSF